MSEKSIIPNNQKFLVNLALAILSAVVIATLVFLSMQASAKSAYQTKSRQLDDANKELSSADLAGFVKEVENIQKGVSNVENFISKGLPYSNLFKDLEKLLPKKVRLANISLGEKKEFKLDGDAQDLSAVAKFMVALEDSDIFSEVKLVSSSAVEKAQGTSIKFSLSGVYNIRR